MTSTEHERRHLARELHDGVTQYVLAAGFALDVARSEAEALGHEGHEGFEASLQTATALTREACTELRRLIAELSDAAAAQPELPALPELVQREAARHRAGLDGLTVLVEVDGTVAPLPDRGDHEVARLVGEALSNAARHGGAVRVVVRLHYRDAALVVSVADDGAGDPADLTRRLRRGPSYDGRHRGLSSMAERAAGLGGTLAFRRARQGGVRVELRVPRAARPAARLERAAR